MTVALSYDDAVRGRDALLALRPAQLGRVLGGVPVEAVERVRAKYRVGHSLRVLYRVAIGGGHRYVVARTFRRPGRAEAIYHEATAGPVAHVPQLDAVFWTFPNDRKIVGLPGLMRMARDQGSRAELVSYAPEKTATVRLVGPSGAAVGYVKAYAGDEGEHTAGVHASLVGLRSSGLAVPSARWDGATRALVVTPAAGRPLALLQGRARERGLALFGASLARLHAVEPPTHRPLARHDVGHLQAAACTITRARPDVAGAALGLAAALVASAPVDDGPPCLLHGDVQPKNAVIDGDRLTLIDLDDAGVGSAAVDLGSLLGALRYSRLLGQISARSERRLSAAFLSGYAEVRPMPAPPSIRWHMSAALLCERALRAVNRVRVDGLIRLDALLAEGYRGL